MEFKMRVFLAYCADDKELYERFQAPLESLFNKHFIWRWTGHEIKPGQKIDEDFKRSLEISNFILLFISPDFFTTEFYDHTILKEAITRHYNIKARVVPIIVKPCNLVKIRDFLKLKALPKANKPISAYENTETAISEVITGIDKAYTEFFDQMEKVIDLAAIGREDLTNDLIFHIGSHIGEEGNEPIAVMNPRYRFGNLTIKDYFEYLAIHKMEGIITYSIAYTFDISGVRDVNLTPKGWARYRSIMFTERNPSF